MSAGSTAKQGLSSTPCSTMAWKRLSFYRNRILSHRLVMPSSDPPAQNSPFPHGFQGFSVGSAMGVACEIIFRVSING